MSKIAILADSGCQLNSREGLYIVPLLVTINEDSYLDGIDIDSAQVFEKMKSDPMCMPKTSQPTSGDLVLAIEKIKDAGYEMILGISIATGLSSTLSGMQLAADMVGMPITLVDSKGTAGNQRYLVEVAESCIAKGMPIEAIKETLDALVETSATVIMASNLDHLKRGGRITPAVALLAGMLKIVPVMKLNNALGGKIDTLAKARTQKKARMVMIEDMQAHGVNAKDYKITVEHVLCEEEAMALVDEIKGHFGKEIDIQFGLLPSVVGVHMGIGGLGLQYIHK